MSDVRVVFGRSEFENARQSRLEAEAFARFVQEQNARDKEELTRERDEMMRNLEKAINGEDVRKAIDILKKAETERERRPDGRNSEAVVKELKKILEKEKDEDELFRKPE